MNEWAAVGDFIEGLLDDYVDEVLEYLRGKRHLHVFSASKGDLALQCPYFLSEELEWTDSVGKSGILGNVVHNAIARVLSGLNLDWDELTFGLTDEERLTCKKMTNQALTWHSVNREGQWFPEVRIAYHPGTDTARVLPPGEHRDYTDVTRDEVAMTVDAIRLTSDGTLYIYDWKTGQFGVDPSVSMQLNIAALAVSRLVPATAIHVGFVYLRKTKVVVKGHDVNSFALDIVREDVKQILAKRGRDPRPGEHCWRCPAKRSCEYSTSKVEAA